MSLFDGFGGATQTSRLDVGLLIRLLATHPGRQNIRWFKAFENPDVDITTKETPAEGKVIRVEQTPPEGTKFLGIFDVHRTSKTLRDGYGAMEEGSSTILYIQESTPLAIGDHVLPWGKIGDGTDVTHKIYHQKFIRGGDRIPGPGRISINASTMTCTVPHTMLVGDVVHFLGQSLVVMTRPSTTTVTFASSPGNQSNLSWEIGRDYIDMVYPKKIESMVKGNGSGGLTVLTAMPIRSTITDATALGSFADPGTGKSRCWIDWASAPTAVLPGVAYSARIEAMPLYRVSESGIQLPGYDFQSIYQNTQYKVILTPQSIPLLANLTQVVRLNP